MDVFYFGCCSKESLGHYLFRKDGWRYGLTETPGPWARNELDARLAPKTTNQQGEALVHAKKSWIYISFWDYTADARGNSNSGFLFSPKKSDERLFFSDYLDLAKNDFPWIFKRFKEAGLEINHYMLEPGTDDNEELL